MSSAVAVSTAADDEATAKYIVLNHVPGESQRQRLTFMEDDGKEIYQQQGQMDTSYLRAMGDEAADKQDKVAAPARDPAAIIELVSQAQGDCDVIVDLLRNLEEARHLDYKMMSGKQRTAQAAMQQITETRMAQAGAHRDLLRRTARRLRAGATALRLAAEQDNHFHSQVAQLQHYWVIRRTPAAMGLGRQAPYLVDLSLSQLLPPRPPAGAADAAVGAAGGAGGGATGGGAGARGGGAAGGAAGAGSATTGDAQQSVFQKTVEQLSAVPLIRGLQGRLQIQLPRQQQLSVPSSQPPTTASQPPATAATASNALIQAPGTTTQLTTTGSGGSEAGTKAERRLLVKGRPDPGQEELDVWVGLLPVHRVLLDRQHEQLWALLLETLDTECAQAVATHNANNFTVRLGRLVADILSRQPRLLDPFLTSLRPLLLEHVLTCRLASQATHTSPYTAPPPAVSHKLLTDLVPVVAHAVARSGLWTEISKQALAYPDVSLHWVPTTRLCTSALQVKTGPMSSCLVVLQDTGVEVDGVVCGAEPGSRTGTDGHTTVSKSELRVLLSDIILGHGANGRETGGNGLADGVRIDGDEVMWG